MGFRLILRKLSIKRRFGEYGVANIYFFKRVFGENGRGKSYPCQSTFWQGVDQYTTDVASVYDSSYISIRLMYPQYGTELFSFLLSAFQGLFLWKFWKDFLMCNTCRGRMKPPNPDIAGKFGLESVSLPQSVCISAPAPS